MTSKSGARKNLILLIGIVGICVSALLLATRTATRKAPITSPGEIPTANIGEIRAKAERGDAEAQKNLGAMYARGQGVQQSYTEAAKWRRLAADQGNAGAQTALGELYEAGQGVPHDDTEAARWFRKAAEQGDSAGQYNLAVLYVMGQGVPQDNTEAVRWYRRAADQGMALAQYNLGMRYYEGKGVAQDPIESFKWLSLAAAQGITDAAEARDTLKTKMSRKQIAESQRLVAGFAAKTSGSPTP